jgi:uronate dehydrogenase
MPLDPATDLVLITGAAGAIGTVLRRGLRDRYRLRLTDIRRIPDLAAGEEAVYLDVADRDGLERVLQGVAALVHLAGVPAEHDLETLFDVNARGVFDTFEAARLAGVRRIVFASSNHAFGNYPIGIAVEPSVPARPDSFYGVFKVMAETMLRYYWERQGISSVSLRIGTFRGEPIDQRSLATWLSPRDIVQLVDLALRHPDPGCLVVNAYSGNTRLKVARTGWDFLGYRPQDDAETFVAGLRARGIDPDGPWEWPEHGGAFVHQAEKPARRGAE